MSITNVDRSRASEKKKAPLRLGYQTEHGRMFVGACEDVMRSKLFSKYRGKVQLLFTSPPFALNRKKKYGNTNAAEYVEWLAEYAPLFRDCLTADGSIVIELGNAWNEGEPTMSTLTMKALLAFQERGELHLCQEFVCFNPARLPSPVIWVNEERIRIKDAFTRVWWMSVTPYPKADNRHVLTEYSESMRKLLRRGTYNAGRRPSEHTIGRRSFLRDNGGAIPPNVLLPPVDQMVDEILSALPVSEVLPISNTRANDPYQEYCKANNLERHPARMPEKLVEFFVKFLTDPGDLVLDPFGGSNTTGAVAESLERRWVSMEVNEDYVQGSKARFPDVVPPNKKKLL